MLCLKRQFTVHSSPASPCIEVHGSKKTCHRVVLLYRALQQKLYRQDFRDVDHLKHVLLAYTAGSDKLDTIDEVPDRLL